MCGDYARAWEHAGQALALALDPPQALTAEEMHALRPHADLVAVVVLVVRGYLDAAKQQIERITHEDWLVPETTSYAHAAAALFYAACYEQAKAHQEATEALRLAGDRDLPEVQALGEAVLGWAEALAGRCQQGIQQLRAALAVSARLGTMTFRFLQRDLLVEACLAGGDTGAAWGTVDDALAQADQTGAHNHDAQFWHLRGEVLLQHGPAAAQEAEGSY